MKILVVGGAGYIGSHAVRELIKNNNEVVVIDNLETGHLNAIPHGVKFYKSDIRIKKELFNMFEKENFEGVMHFAANSLVGESMVNPLKYYDNNLHGTQNLLHAMVEYNVNKIVFSSTAATYGEPKEIPITEQCETNPTNTYGETKLAIEKMLKWFSKAYDLHYVCLRYFNVAGADILGEIGEDHSPETHLIPIVLQVPLGKREAITVYGNDYDTEDGTCIRDYIHVTDLINAHILAMNYLSKGNESSIFNLGSSNGYSVKEIITAAREVTGNEIPEIIGQRRSGDPSILIASSKKAEEILGWKAKYTDVKDIISTAWNWHKNHPNGYGEDNNE
ncbi:UDP-glucose 4-epimerase GalE [Clostridium sp. MSJ-4]|uniref:UDP-glucose 4-epimerase n=1 Tax=Clostridium simiarum TaxID=2841506 RepID=A0ABS6F4C4_9CLOT|nr:UDP-glucose 4-epimerase GalE [Clostridium simiarum]MBU5593367.1 UDP-glucose 4-epimerase GalE [Clostridium simiarum]